ncbi:MAG: lytic transglycosylase domain-containing protein [Phycisphaerae bacterium]|nr:lytic transglycosylase domain-containing protein [Phycisphaerae bacterium]
MTEHATGKSEPASDGLRLRPGGTLRPTLKAVIAVVVLIGGIVLISLWLYERTVAGRLAAQDVYIRRWASEYDVEPDVIRAVIRVESNGKPGAVSDRGAKGLMQVTDAAERDVLDWLGIERPEEVRRIVRERSGATSRITGEKDLFDPEYNIRIGTAYLRMMLNRFGGDLILALAAYNRGPTALTDFRRQHPQLTSWQLVRSHAPAETRGYVRKVFEHLGRELPQARDAGR